MFFSVSGSGSAFSSVSASDESSSATDSAMSSISPFSMSWVRRQALPVIDLRNDSLARSRSSGELSWVTFVAKEKRLRRLLFTLGDRFSPSESQVSNGGAGEDSSMVEGTPESLTDCLVVRRLSSLSCACGLPPLK